MEKPAFKGVARKGITHQYSSRLVAFEYTPRETTTPPQNIIIFIGGLFDGLHTVSYVDSVAEALPSSWSIAQVLLSSSYTGWGTSSLQKDVKELSKCVSYFRAIKSGKIVLLGHSTGCQDVMEYLTGPGYEEIASIDGGVIQAPVSDREAMLMHMDPEVYSGSCAAAQKMVENGDENEILPSVEYEAFFPCPVTAKRWLSLASPNHDGDDDYFSSDLKEEQLMKSFGGLPAGPPLCILFSGSDEYMAESIDKKLLGDKWISISKRGKGKIDEDHSGVVEGASHNLNGNPEEVVLKLVKRVVGFVNELSPQPNL
ncbi:hypothetical protein BGZ60DRAFT_432983 [Tricladium varicosporioides]|nr:hypothetical protein BGZ60DRAFT_432983 [Hymenoscyphus varicosporioides]